MVIDRFNLKYLKYLDWWEIENELINICKFLLYIELLVIWLYDFM